MNQPMHLKPEDPAAVFNRLNDKFTINLKAQLTPVPDAIELIEMQARGILAIGSILREKHALTATQKETCRVFDEVFADLITSVYLAACALDKPAQMVLRRALEIGIATVYLWDQPHIFWGWKNCDQDLSFNDMLDHLDSKSVLGYVAARNPAFGGDHLFDLSAARRFYRVLSNSVHGKIALFETQLQDSFSVNASDWKAHLDQVAQIQRLLYSLWYSTFYNLEADLKMEMPQLVRCA